MFPFSADPTDCPVVSSQSKGELGWHLGEGPKRGLQAGEGEIDVLQFFPPLGSTYWLCDCMAGVNMSLQVRC